MLKKYYDAVYLRDLKELIYRSAEKYGTWPAFMDLNAEENIYQYSYIQLKEDIEALGTKLLDLGLQGKHFALIGDSSYSYVVSYLAVVNGIGVLVPLDKELPNDDLIKLIYKCDAEVILYSNCLLADINEIKSACKDVTTTINISMYADSYKDLNFNLLVSEGMELILQGIRNPETTLGEIYRL